MQTDPNSPLSGIPEPKGKIAKKCDLSGEVSRKCPNLNVFPGCASPGSGTALSSCIDDHIQCELCKALNIIDGFSRNCDQFDNGVIDGSCL